MAYEWCYKYPIDPWQNKGSLPLGKHRQNLQRQVHFVLFVMLFPAHSAFPSPPPHIKPPFNPIALGKHFLFFQFNKKILFYASTSQCLSWNPQYSRILCLMSITRARQCALGGWGLMGHAFNSHSLLWQPWVCLEYRCTRKIISFLHLGMLKNMHTYLMSL